MGGCASVYNKKESEKSRVMKKLSLIFKTKKNDFMIISSPIKHNNNNNNNNNNNKPSFNPHFSITSNHPFNSSNGSKEDAFFDSNAWLDSDCDDDFVSVRGDFTPSRGNTPVHHNFSVGTIPVNKSIFNESSSEPSPNTKKKRLSELFKDSLREDQGDFADLSNDNLANTKVEKKTIVLGILDGTSETSSNNGDRKTLKEKTLKSSWCCLPMMRSTRSFNERSKMRPVKSVG